MCAPTRHRRFGEAGFFTTRRAAARGIENAGLVGPRGCQARRSSKRRRLTGVEMKAGRGGLAIADRSRRPDREVRDLATPVTYHSAYRDICTDFPGRGSFVLLNEKGAPAGPLLLVRRGAKAPLLPPRGHSFLPSAGFSPALAGISFEGVEAVPSWTASFAGFGSACRGAGLAGRSLRRLRVSSAVSK